MRPIAYGKILATGSSDRIMSFAAQGTQIVDLQGHTVIPGLNDSHLHLIRGGLNYNLELSWEGVPSLADALWMLKDQADRTPSPQWVRDGRGNPTGMLIAKPNAMILYATLAKGPKLPLEQQVNSTRQFMRELNRLGLTSAIDAGGGFQNYPKDYEIIEQLHAQQQMTVRIAYNLFTQRPKQELDDFERWADMLKPGQGTDFFRANGAGEMLVFPAADFEDFLQSRPDLPEGMDDELERVEHRWPFHLHATYDESISRMLDVFEKVNRDIPFNGLHWFFDHAETITEWNIVRVKALGGGIAVQHRMAFQGEYFVDRYGKEALKHTPPVAKMLALEVPVGLGTLRRRKSGR